MTSSHLLDCSGDSSQIINELQSDIYSWLEDELCSNLIRLCQPKYLDELKSDTLSLYTQLLGFSDMLVDTCPVHFVGLDTKQFPTRDEPDISICTYNWSDSESCADTTITEDTNVSEHHPEKEKETVSLKQLIRDTLDLVMSDHHIPAYCRPDDTESDDLQLDPEFRRNQVPDDVELQHITNTLDRLSAVRYPAQRSPEWYESRRNLFSASSIYKLYTTPAQYNSLIYEKCGPSYIKSIASNVDAIDVESSELTTNKDVGPGEAVDARTWGVKYEPLSAALYEHMNPGTRVRTDYGCIPHQKYSCLGASPDGVNVSLERPDKYGRMVEIKNIVNREITGIPKLEYWIQMQFQMEVCGLSKCDFVETRFVEYHTEKDFYDDVDETVKGVILLFTPKEKENQNKENQNKETPGVPEQNQTPSDLNQDKKDKDTLDCSDTSFPPESDYLVVNMPTGWNDPSSSKSVKEKKCTVSSEFVYMPFYVRHDYWAIQAYIREQCKHRELTHELSSTTYWCLDQYSCVVVDHNMTWIQEAIPIANAAWDTVQRERITGAEHRAPKKRACAPAVCLV